MGSRAKESKTNGYVGLIEQAPDIHKVGYLKKLKTMRKKFFVMRRESAAGPARLECYDSEKKWKCGVLPKRSVELRTCFNINRRADAKQRHVLALHTRDDTLALVAESEEERESWLVELLRLQHGGCLDDAEARPKPLFEHVWQVNIKPKGLGSSRNILGAHRLCLTAKSLSLVKMPSDQEEPEALEFPLMSIRRCGHSDCFFFMELGRSSVTGSGELWMQTEDTVIAQNVHETILGAMKTSYNKEDLGPMSRPRSSSTSENSKPISHKRPSHLLGSSVPTGSVSVGCRDRSDSMPTSRSRNTSESHSDSSVPGHAHVGYGRVYSASPPSSSHMVVGSYDSACSSFSTDEPDGQTEYFNRYSHSLPVDILAGPKEPTIKEEGTADDYLVMASPVGNQSDSTLHHPAPLPQSHPTSEPSEYLKMSMSPTSSIPETSDGYIPMSPVGSLGSTAEKGSAAALHVGYLSMEPQGSSRSSVVPHTTAPAPEGYMDMAPLSSSLPKSVGDSCTDFSGSWCSAHSLQDVPSSASPLSASLEGFHLEKVKSYFSPSEDDSEDYIKPVRAYSIGSRQQVQKSHLSAQLEQSRVRAYSVGSQAAPAALRRRNHKEADPEVSSLRNSNSSKKSSSVPLLPEAASEKSSPTTTPHADYSEDLMEINYDKKWETKTDEKCKVRTTAPPSTLGVSRKAEEAGTPKEFAPRKLSSGSREGSASRGRKNADYSYMHMGAGDGRSPFADCNYLPLSYYSGEGLNGITEAVCTKENCRKGADALVETRRDTVARILREGSASAPSNGNSDYVLSERVGLSVPSTNTPRLSSTPESSQLGEYVNLDLSKTWKWTQPVRSSVPLVQPALAPLASMADVVDPLLEPPEASYENISLGDGLPVERVLNYASLDLAPPSSSEEGNGTRSPRGGPPPTVEDECPTFMYAEIDFTKSEGLRNVSGTLREGRL
uniref:Insulin receptor substrate 1 n=1 Tax=Ornithodoros turicata TaxID=34597 RepID=A0A2R5L924_9ACAR